MKLNFRTCTQIQNVKFWIWDGCSRKKAIEMAKMTWTGRELWISLSNEEMAELKEYENGFKD